MPPTKTDSHQPPRTALVVADDAEARASAYYESGFHCGESVLRAVTEVAGGQLSPEVTRMASGFCAGIGGSRCVCGALAGGVMALGLLAGRESSDDPWEPSYYAAAKLRARWILDQHAETCAEVVDRFEDMADPRRWEHCARLVGRTARWVVEIADSPGPAVR